MSVVEFLAYAKSVLDMYGLTNYLIATFVIGLAVMTIQFFRDK